MPNAFYQKRIEDLTNQLDFQQKKMNQIMVLRISVFLIIILLVSLSVSFSESSFLYGLIPLSFVFGFLVLKNQKEKTTLEIIKKKIQVNEEETKAIQGNFSCFSSGKGFIDSQHPYTHDLDVFGEKSLFQFLNRTISKEGEKKLALYLSQFETDSSKIIERQKAIEELSSKNLWREEFRAKGMVYSSENQNIDRLFKWAQDEIPCFNSPFMWRIFLVVIPAFILVMFIGYGVNVIPGSLLILSFFIPLGMVGSKLRVIQAQHNKISEFLPLLKQHNELSFLIENENFKTNLLQTIQSKLKTESTSASAQIKKLSSITQQFDNRSNPVFALLFNALFIWDLQYLFKLKNWLVVNENHLKNWFEAVAQFEVYASFGFYCFNSPSHIFPQVSDSKVLHTNQLAHPLLTGKNRVSNDFTIQNIQEFEIITGANMAGKSTFLRAIGVNLILAMSGAPVCASSFSFTPIRLFSSMRTTDSLSQNESYFYSELKRLQTIIELLNKGEKLFIVLDEILKGTNSKDKAAGSKKFIAQLLKYQTSGIIATHDLSLCALKEDFPSQIQTHYFDVEIKNDELVFDYKLKTGVCSNMNAEFLMKKMGITD